MGKTIQLKRSNVVLENNTPKTPAPGSLLPGEIALNYAAGYETLSMQNDNGEIVTLTINGNMQTVAESLAMHEARNDNPHGVTKAQVGLGNVDNTADIDKPVSTAQQAAINAKLNKVDVIDNLTTNDATKALSAAQGIVLLALANAASGGATADLTALNTRILACEQEIDGTEAQVDQLISFATALKDDECDTPDITLS